VYRKRGKDENFWSSSPNIDKPAVGGQYLSLRRIMSGLQVIGELPSAAAMVASGDLKGMMA